jgi:hypothetical protein
MKYINTLCEQNTKYFNIVACYAIEGAVRIGNLFY